MSRRAARLLMGLSVCLVLVSAMTLGADAQSTPPSLAGEVFNSPGGEFFFDPIADFLRGTCDPNGISSVEFVATTSQSGVQAAGPYPGPFDEPGTFSFGPQAPIDLIPGDRTPLFTGVTYTTVPLDSFNAAFTIDSVEGLVEGTVSLIAGQAACATPSDGQGSYTLFVAVDADLTYEATITTADGTYTDSGSATFTARYLRVVSPTRGASQQTFIQTFTASDGVEQISTPTPTPSPTDEPTDTPTPEPTLTPTQIPTNTPTAIPSVTPRPMPTTKEQCKHGGYANYGFSNQGQCIRYVNTGK